MQQIKQGDYLLCYLTGISRFIGVLEVTSDPYWNETRIWKDDVFPCRVNVEVIAALTPETAVPALELREQLTIFQNLKNPNAWSGPFRRSPAEWKQSDGEAVVYAVMEAVEHPVKRPVDKAKLTRRTKALRVNGETFTVPETEDTELSLDEISERELPASERAAAEEVSEASKEMTAHTEVQWALLKLGSDMGLDVWVARNDRGREAHGRPFSDIPRLKNSLPLQFDQVTNRTIELIDVLWLRGNAIVAAFETEGIVLTKGAE